MDYFCPKNDTSVLELYCLPGFLLALKKKILGSFDQASHRFMLKLFARKLS